MEEKKVLEMFAPKRNRKQIEKERLEERRFFKNILKPLREKDPLDDTNEIQLEFDSKSNSRGSEVPVISIKCNVNDTVVVDKRQCRKGYKVLAIRDDGYGRKTIFDPVDGTVFNCSILNKITNFVPLFDTRIAALNERRDSCKVSNFLHYLILLLQCFHFLLFFTAWERFNEYR